MVAARLMRTSLKLPLFLRNATEHRSHRTGRRDLHGLLRGAELHGRAQFLLSGMHPLRTGMIPPQLHRGLDRSLMAAR